MEGVDQKSSGRLIGWTLEKKTFFMKLLVTKLNTTTEDQLAD
jgi:hypothetical protein